MWVLEVLGLIVVGGTVLFSLMFLAFKRLKPDVPPEVKPWEMPHLVPVPIRTKHRGTAGQLLTWLFSVRSWELGQDWLYTLPSGDRVKIPKAFEFDGPSVPRPFWAILSPVGLLLIPGLVHDYSYQFGKLLQVQPDGSETDYHTDWKRADWDRLFYDVGLQVNGIWLLSFIAWLGVRVGGRGIWCRHRETDRLRTPAS